MRFTYQAPVEYNDLTSGLRTVESRYKGPHDFKVKVHRITRLITGGVEFDHDGHPSLHNGTDISDPDYEMIYLHSHNPNHICLMALITGHEEHEAPNVVETVCAKYNMVYQRHEPMDLFHTFDLQKTTIDSRGVVKYVWWQMVITWETLVSQGLSHISVIQERMKSYMTNADRAKAERCIEIVNYVIENEISMKHPWKIAWPSIDTVTLDNSVPIGLGGGSTPDVDWVTFEEDPDTWHTCKWGVVEHEHADRPVGSGLLASVNPMTDAEVAATVPWVDSFLTAEHPSHSTKCDHYLECDDHLCHTAGPTAEVTMEQIHQHHAEEWEKIKSSN